MQSNTDLHDIKKIGALFKFKLDFFFIQTKTERLINIRFHKI